MKQNERKSLVKVSGRDTRQCHWDFYATPGPGGQHRNKCKNAARVTHIASGAVAQCSEYKSKEQNKKAAWKRLAMNTTFKAWLKRECARVDGSLAKIEKLVENQMQLHNLKVERKNEKGLWEEWKPTDKDWNERSSE